MKPWGVTFDPVLSRILITDIANNNIQVLSRGDLSVTDCFGSRGSGIGQFYGPAGITVQPHGGNLVVSDVGNHRVQVLTPEGRHLTTIGAAGQASNKDGLFNSPIGVCCKPQGDICVVDQYNHRVQLFDAAGRYLSKFGAEGIIENKFRFPFDIAVLDHRFAPSSVASSVLLVADYWNYSVSVWITDGSRLINEFDVIGRPRGICVDQMGYVYVSSDRTLEVFDPRVNFQRCSMIVSSTFIKCSTIGLKWPTGMCVDDKNTLFVVDSNKIHVIDL